MSRICCKTVLSQMIDGLDVAVKWTDDSRMSLIMVSIGGIGQVNYMTIDVHARLSAAKRVDYYSKYVALMWEAVGEVGVASRLDAEASRVDSIDHHHRSRVQIPRLRTVCKQ